MEFTPTSIPDVALIEPKIFGDERGFFGGHHGDDYPVLQHLKP